jgi:hypothetical protein
MILVGKVAGGMKDEALIGRTLMMDLDKVSALFIDVKRNIAHVEIDSGSKSGSVEVGALTFYTDWRNALMGFPEVKE